MSSEIPYIAGLRSLAAAYDAFIVDLWGVVYEEQRLCFGVFNALSQLSDAGKKVVFLSNSPLRSADMVKTLERMGIKRYLYYGVLTAGEVIYHELRRRVDPFFLNLGRKCFHIGPENFWQPYADLGYVPVSNIDEADFIFVTGTMGNQDSLEKYEPFFRVCLSRRLPMVCACPDSFILKDGTPYMAAGALAAQYQKVGGTVFWRGKPDPSVFLYCAEGLETEKSRIAVIGDCLQTDIYGANLSGLDALFVAGGIHAKELGINRGQQPEADRVSSLLNQHDCTAKAVLPAFVW
ncbi:MAG: TIGR01459 family HAD-type hydrolase [Alphaproteobacteria bacterium]|nr:TIGR01459 family HAD-type hydrolase [Alphaproteobacteria bacterium]